MSCDSFALHFHEVDVAVVGTVSQVVAETLQVKGDEEVEEWVLRAIHTGLLEAKMDQMQRVVVIRRCTNRVFGPAQWKVSTLYPV